MWEQRGFVVANRVPCAMLNIIVLRDNAHLLAQSEGSGIIDNQLLRPRSCRLPDTVNLAAINIKHLVSQREAAWIMTFHIGIFAITISTISLQSQQIRSRQLE